MYVLGPQIGDAAYIISYVVDHIERIRYTAYPDSTGSIYTIYPRQVVVPGSYAPELFSKRRLSVHEVRRAY